MRNLIFWGRNARTSHWMQSFSILLVLLLVTVFITLYSCEKEDEILFTEQQDNDVISSNFERILAFKDMLEAENSGGLSFRTTYTPAEMVWNIEAGMNYTYGQPHLQFDDFDVSETEITVNEISGSITPTVLARVYDEVLEFVECHYDDVTYADKELKLVDVYLISGQNKIGVTSVVGDLTSVASSFWLTSVSFTSGQNWKGIGGNCAGTASVQKNGATEIGRLTNWNLAPHSVNASYSLTDIQIHDIFPADYPDYSNYNPNDPTEDDWVIDYMVWWLDYCEDNSNDPCSGVEVEAGIAAYTDALCIEYDELNFYLANVEDYIEDVEDDLTKVFVHTDMDANASLTFEYFLSWYESILFATKNTNVIPLSSDLEKCR